MVEGGELSHACALHACVIYTFNRVRAQSFLPAKDISCSLACKLANASDIVPGGANTDLIRGLSDGHGHEERNLHRRLRHSAALRGLEPYEPGTWRASCFGRRGGSQLGRPFEC